VIERLHFCDQIMKENILLTRLANILVGVE
jgi:hypothetical protein